MLLDEAELERTLDLWASMWLAEERVQFERALERVVDGDAAAPLKAVAVAACRIIATPRLLGAAERSWWFMEESTLAAIEAVVEVRARVCGTPSGWIARAWPFCSTRRCAIRAIRSPTSCSIASTFATCTR